MRKDGIIETEIRRRKKGGGRRKEKKTSDGLISQR